MKKYIIIIKRSGSSYVAYSPDVPDCSIEQGTIQGIIYYMAVKLRRKIEAMPVIPEPKGLKYCLEKGLIDESQLGVDYLITAITIDTDKIIQPTCKSVTFKVIARRKDQVDPKPEMRVVKDEDQPQPGDI